MQTSFLRTSNGVILNCVYGCDTAAGTLEEDTGASIDEDEEDGDADVEGVVCCIEEDGIIEFDETCAANDVEVDATTDAEDVGAEIDEDVPP